MDRGIYAIQKNQQLKGSLQTHEILLRVYVEENQKLKEKLDCDLKWSFKCDELTKENKKLKEQLEKERKARKEAIEYIKNDMQNTLCDVSDYVVEKLEKEFLEILDNKGEKKDE